MLKKQNGIILFPQMTVGVMGSAGGSLGAGVRERLLDQLERIYRQHILPRYSRVLEGRDPDGVVAV